MLSPDATLEEQNEALRQKLSVVGICPDCLDSYVVIDTHVFCGNIHCAEFGISVTTATPLLTQRDITISEYRGILDEVIARFLGTLKAPACDLSTALVDSSQKSELQLLAELKRLTACSKVSQYESTLRQIYQYCESDICRNAQDISNIHSMVKAALK